MITMLNSCKYVAFAYQVTTDQLMEWNPSLSTNASACALQPGYSYCVLESEDSITREDSGTFCLSINATESTTVSNCNCFTKVFGYMSNGRTNTGSKVVSSRLMYTLDYTCAGIVDDVDITEAELLAWNPWLAGDCDTELYMNITGNEVRAVCIGIDTNATTTASNTPAVPTPADTIPI
ncbi:hypothetical protein N7522_001514 [Penicillium canescens]|nr:hypothetical protein N7522_001514 [Penicillium canescens]